MTRHVQPSEQFMAGASAKRDAWPAYGRRAMRTLVQTMSKKKAYKSFCAYLLLVHGSSTGAASVRVAPHVNGVRHGGNGGCSPRSEQSSNGAHLARYV